MNQPRKKALTILTIVNGLSDTVTEKGNRNEKQKEKDDLKEMQRRKSNYNEKNEQQTREERERERRKAPFFGGALITINQKKRN